LDWINIFFPFVLQQLLNHCFDDIERFVSRLQQAAEAYKELERRRRERGGKNKKNVSGDGMLGHRARPPPAQDFVDIFQKFKLSFNLLVSLFFFVVFFFKGGDFLLVFLHKFKGLIGLFFW
jgi:hypothetical protein